MNGFKRHVCFFMLMFGLIISFSCVLQNLFPSEEQLTTAQFPYERAMDNLREILTGPYAFSLSTTGVVLIASILLFGEGDTNIDTIKHDGEKSKIIGKTEQSNPDVVATRLQHNRVIEYYCVHCGSKVDGNRCDSCGAPRRK